MTPNVFFIVLSRSIMWLVVLLCRLFLHSYRLVLSIEAVYPLRVIWLCELVVFLNQAVSCCVLLEFGKILFSLLFLFLIYCISSFTIPLDREYLPSAQKWLFYRARWTFQVQSLKMFLIYLSHGRSFLVFCSYRNTTNVLKINVRRWGSGGKRDWEYNRNL